MFYLTTSWDDGHKLDLRLAKLLDKYGVKGTFYVSKNYADIGELLSEDDIREIARTHEIGAHTLSHQDLTKITEQEAKREIVESKVWLEKVLGKDVPMFCYPSGLYNSSVAKLVEDAGFAGARTVAWPYINLPAFKYEMATSLPVYPLPFRKLAGGRIWWRKLLQPLFQRYRSLHKLGVPIWRMYSWGSAAKAAFDYAYKNGSTFHLWGHSWEIENYGLWTELESFLEYAKSKTEINFVTNAELLDIASNQISVLGEDAYGSWAISPLGLNEGSVVYSFGAGTDISWDLAMIEQFGMSIHVFDPTQKSIDWMAKQTLPQKFIFHPCGLSDKDGVETFYPPPNPKNVSYSTVRKLGAKVDLRVKRLETIMREFGHSHIDLLKIDIEGSEYKVIDDLVNSKLPISQILVEFHDRFVGKGQSLVAVRKLQIAGYKVLCVSPGGDEYTLIKA